MGEIQFGQTMGGGASSKSFATRLLLGIAVFLGCVVFVTLAASCGDDAGPDNETVEREDYRVYVEEQYVNGNDYVCFIMDGDRATESDMECLLEP